MVQAIIVMICLRLPFFQHPARVAQVQQGQSPTVGHQRQSGRLERSHLGALACKHYVLSDHPRHPRRGPRLLHVSSEHDPDEESHRISGSER